MHHIRDVTNKRSNYKQNLISGHYQVAAAIQCFCCMFGNELLTEDAKWIRFSTVTSFNKMMLIFLTFCA